MNTVIATPRISSDSVSLAIATSEPLIRDFKKLVFEQYGIRGWLDPKNGGADAVSDKFDPGSAVLVIQSESEIVAGMRIVRDHGMGFPHEAELGLDKVNVCAPHVGHILSRTPRSRMAEITKVVGKKFGKRALTLDIVKCLFWYAQKNDIDVYVMVIDMEFFLLCGKFGVPIQPMGTPVYCEGSWTIPAITIPGHYPESIMAKSPRGWEYIQTEDNLYGSWMRH